MSMKLIIVVCVVCATDGLFRGADGLYAANAVSTLWKMTVDTTAHYPCENPQPRAFKATELLTGIEATDTVTPHTIVLHRCDESSGCCEHARESCWPLVTHWVDLMFVVQSAEMRQRRATYAGVNHTKCTCSEAEVSTIQESPWVR